MDGMFACPECSYEIALGGLSPGRHVRCDWCGTLVEVPFLPRAPEVTKFRQVRHWRPWWKRRIRVIVGVVLGLVLALSGRILFSHERAGAERALADHSTAADENERAKRFGTAVNEIDQAIQIAMRVDGPGSARLETLRRRREQLSLHAVESRLVEVAKEAPDRSIADCTRLLAQIHKDPALSSLEAAVREQLDRSRERLAATTLEAARKAFQAGQSTEVLDRCERLAELAGDLPPSARAPLLSECDTLVASVVGARGIVLEPVHGRFTFGSATGYDALLHPPLEVALRRLGYVPRRPSSPWPRLWNERAPFRFTIEMNERQQGTYLQSRNRLSAIDATLVLHVNGQTAWRSGPIAARTRTDLPNMPAFQASRMAIGERPNAEFEHRFYDDARAVFLEKYSAILGKIPPFDGSTTSPGIRPTP
jgi:hypothetical protein